jgi:hypothetical protein
LIALSLGGLRRRIEAALMADDVMCGLFSTALPGSDQRRREQQVRLAE